VRSSNPDTAFDSHHERSKLVRPPGPCQLRPALSNVYTTSSSGSFTSIRAFLRRISASPPCYRWTCWLSTDRWWGLVQPGRRWAVLRCQLDSSLEHATILFSPSRLSPPSTSFFRYPMLPAQQSHAHHTKATTHHMPKQQSQPKCLEGQRARSILLQNARRGRITSQGRVDAPASSINRPLSATSQANDIGPLA
jgi:hypothetical protein